MGITAETAQEELHLLVDHRVVDHKLMKGLAVFLVGQFTFKQQVAGIQVVALGSQLFNRVTTIKQFTFVAIDIRDGRLTRRGGQKARVVSEHACLAVELADVDDIRTHVDKPANQCSGCRC